MYTRYSKLALVWSVALFASLVAYGNIADYNSNYQFVVHVLSMDTTFPDNSLKGRAIDSSALHHAAYNSIIFLELLVGILCWWGGIRLFKCIGNAAEFNRAKGVAIAALTLGFLLWFTGFLTVGGEWFLMWQSKVYNGQSAAFRIAAMIGIVLLYLVQPDAENNA
jgi:predicted small integral membrane protein